MRFVPFLLVLAACGEVHQVHRWPGHRRERDEQVRVLTESAAVQSEKTIELEARVRKLEQELEKLRHAPQPAPAALPSPGT
jgi:hypothetical protein